MTTFCPKCGNPRTGQLRFCRVCGFDFDAPEPPAPPPTAVIQTPSTTSPTNVAGMAGVAWLISAGATAYLAYQQWTYGSAVGATDFTTVASWNAVAALITLYFGARLIASPSHSLFTQSAVWSAISVISGVAQISGGDSVGDVFVVATITAAAAGALSFVGRQQAPSQGPDASLVPTDRTWGPEDQAGARMVCGRCHKPLSPVWRGRCEHCGARYAEVPPLQRLT